MEDNRTVSVVVYGDDSAGFLVLTDDPDAHPDGVECVKHYTKPQCASLGLSGDEFEEAYTAEQG